MPAERPSNKPRRKTTKERLSEIAAALMQKKKPEKAKTGLSQLSDRVKLATSPREIAKMKIGRHLMDILKKGGYLKSAQIDGAKKDILNARNEEEAVSMVNDLVANFEHALKEHPELFEGLSRPITLNETFKEMLIHSTEGGNLYWDIDVTVNGDDLRVTAPLRLAG